MICDLLSLLKLLIMLGEVAQIRVFLGIICRFIFV